MDNMSKEEMTKIAQQAANEMANNKAAGQPGNVAFTPMPQNILIKNSPAKSVKVPKEVENVLRKMTQ